MNIDAVLADLNQHLAHDPTFAVYMRTPFYYQTSSEIAGTSRAVYGTHQPSPLTPLGLLNITMPLDKAIALEFDDSGNAIRFIFVDAVYED